MPASVEFHTGVADPVRFACRLLRKAYRAGSRVLVTAPGPLLQRLDQDLWTFDAHDFVPHICLGGAADEVARRTPLWLATSVPASGLPPVLINIGAAAPQAAHAFERVIEIVADDPEARAAGRARWRHYEAWPVTPLHHGAAR
jgi:DNA polymerase-3 subunit chi